MDRVIAKKKWSKKRILTIAGIAGLVALIAGAVYSTSGKSKLNVETDRITISEVTKGPFQESIPVNGVVLPQTSIYLDAVEGGRVEERYVEDGTIMKKGDPILRLSNTDLELSLVSQETQVYNLLAQMQIARNNAQQNTVSKLNQMTDVESQLKEAERITPGKKSPTVSPLEGYYYYYFIFKLLSCLYYNSYARYSFYRLKLVICFCVGFKKKCGGDDGFTSSSWR